MPKLAVQATTTHEIKLTPKQLLKMRKELKAYASLKEQKKATEHAMKGCSTRVGEVLFEVEETSLSVDGYKATIVAGVRETLDKDKLKAKLVAAGLPIEAVDKAFDACTTKTPNEPYVKITTPKAKGEKDED